MPSSPTSRIPRPASLLLMLLLTAAALHAVASLQPDTHDVTSHGAFAAARATRRIDASRWSSHPHPRGRSRGLDASATGTRDTNDADGRWCWYLGARHADGARVDTPEPCLRCRCARGALVCYLRVCPALPDSPPDGCLVHYARGSCCPTLRCSEGLKRYGSVSSDGAARLDEDEADLAFPAPFSGGGCVLRGTLYAEGSAMSSSSACEHCFCIGGRQRCVRPTCLPPPLGCEPEPPGRASLSTANGCCPARYRCTSRNLTTHAPHLHQGTGCVVGRRRYPDGERVPGVGAGAASCDNCFCLRGLVRCLASTCAPALLGCTPLLRPGECCPHSYDCSTSTLDDGAPLDLLSVTDNFITSPKNEDRSFHGDLVGSESATKPVAAKLRQTTDLPKKYKTTTRNGQFSLTPLKVTTDENQTSSQVQTSSAKSTTASSPEQGSRVVSSTTTGRDVTEQGAGVTSTTTATMQTTPQEPDETMRVVINGTINCTAELSTSTFPVGAEPATIGDAEDRVSEVDTENYTFNPNDLITEGPGDDSFTVNVSTLLRTNMSAATLPPVAVIPVEIEALINMSKKREDYDYDYGAATLPPSLPNLKIIPFVAADAVVEGTPADPAADQSYTPLASDRSDKFPAYLPSSSGSEADRLPTYGTDETRYAQQLHSLSSLLLSNRDESTPTVSHRDSNQYSLVTSRSEFDATDVGSPTPPPPHFVVGSHGANLFSPPVRTEGGFLPKAPPIPDDYYGVSYRRPTPLTPERTRAPLTPPPPIDIAHHAPSINFDRHKECVSSEGLRVAPGETIEGVGVGGGGSTECSRCMCTWGVLLCSDTCDPPPPGCTHTASNTTHCCPFVCEDVKNSSTTTAPHMQQSPSSTNRPPVSTTTDFRPVFSFDTVHTEPIPHRDLFSTTPATTLDSHISEKTGNFPSQAHIERPTDRTTSANENQIAVVEDLMNITSSYFSSSPSLPTTPSPEVSANSTPVVPLQESAEYEEQPEEQESEEEEDDGFSFGSVLKLLLSDGYDATTTKPYRHTTTTAKPSPVPMRMSTFTATVHRSTSAPAKFSTSTSTRKPVVVTSVSSTTPQPSKTSPSFRPLATRPVLAPSVSTPVFAPGGVKKGDQLMLGEVSAIERRPVTANPFVPTASTSTTTTTTTSSTSRAPSSIEDNVIRDSEPAPPGAASQGFGGGMLKLAGCNIYGRMYRVGRIISELSNACLQCMCTEIGVQCHPLRC